MLKSKHDYHMYSRYRQRRYRLAGPNILLGEGDRGGSRYWRLQMFLMCFWVDDLVLLYDFTVA